jgi:hypothetical protein
MRGPQTLLDAENNWETDLGAWFPGERVVFRGKDLFQELGDSSWMGLLLFGITGREFNEKQIRLFEGIWTISTSYPDPRLWNNRIAALAATSRSTGSLGISAATAASEADIYGQKPMVKIIDFLFRAKKKLEQGVELIEIIETETHTHKIFGFGRPLISSDERIQPLLHLVNKLGYGKGVYIDLLFQIEKILLEGRLHLNMNIAALDAALAADQGLTTNQFYKYMLLCFSVGQLTCSADSFSKPAGSFFPLRCRRIRYEGRPRRSWSTSSFITTDK